MYSVVLIFIETIFACNKNFRSAGNAFSEKQLVNLPRARGLENAPRTRRRNDDFVSLLLVAKLNSDFQHSFSVFLKFPCKNSDKNCQRIFRSTEIPTIIALSPVFIMFCQFFSSTLKVHDFVCPGKQHIFNTCSLSWQESITSKRETQRKGGATGQVFIDTFPVSNLPFLRFFFDFVFAKIAGFPQKVVPLVENC